MGALKSIVRAYDAGVSGLAALAGVLVGAACALIVVDVTIRTLGFPPPAYTIALVEFGLLYITMLAAPYLVRERGHVYIDAVVSRLPRPLELAVAKLTYAIAIAASLSIMVLSAQLFREAVESGFYDEQGVDMPYWSLYLPIPVGFGLVAIEFARYLFGSQLMHRVRTDVEGSV
jgi:TRAP-type C4-dicarboxylate transport system permease small subunit